MSVDLWTVGALRTGKKLTAVKGVLELELLDTAYELSVVRLLVLTVLNSKSPAAKLHSHAEQYAVSAQALYSQLAIHLRQRDIYRGRGRGRDIQRDRGTHRGRKRESWREPA